MRTNPVGRVYIAIGLVLIVICIGGIVLMAMQRSISSPAVVEQQWDPEDCDAQDKAQGEWDECWAEFLKTKGKSPTPRPTFIGGRVLPTAAPRTAAPAPPPRTPGPIRTTKRKAS